MKILTIETIDERPCGYLSATGNEYEIGMYKRHKHVLYMPFRYRDRKRIIVSAIY